MSCTDDIEGCFLESRHKDQPSMEGLDLSILEPQAVKRHRQEALPDGALQAQGVDLGQLAFPLPAVTDVRAC